LTPPGPSEAPDLAATLVGVDGLDVQPEALPTPDPARPIRLDEGAAEYIRAEITRAGGREVCFLAELTADRVVVKARAVARGNRAAVLAVAHDAQRGGIMIHNHPSGLLEPSEADMSVAARVFEEGLGTAITTNQADDLYVVVEPPKPKVRIPLDLDALEARIGPEGPLAHRHPRYEDRAGQRDMLRRVADRYNEEGVLLVEAGTGTGKSLAYLLPAAQWALDNDERTVISTGTINLQEQLVGKDLPLVAELVEGELTWALVKGRGNYVSIRRAELAAMTAGDLFQEDRTRELDSILEWIRTTEDGSLADLPAAPSPEVWEEVRSDPDACLRARCPHFQECFFQRSRRRANSARILVVNHHMLFTDIAVRRATQNWTQSAVLPAYRHLVLDEAHNIEDAATENLGATASALGVTRLLSRLDRRGKGILNSLADGLKRSEVEVAVQLRSRIEEKVRPAVEDARARAKLFFEAVEPLVLQGPRGGGGSQESETVRIGEGEGTIPEPVQDLQVSERLNGLLGALQRLAFEMVELRRGIEADERLEEGLEGRLLDLRGSERRVLSTEAALRLVLRPGERELELVRWVEVRGKGRRRNLILAAAPIELGPILRESLFSKMASTVLTSATLATRDDNFDFLKGRLGLDAHGLSELEHPVELVERVVQSPFDFYHQSLLVVPTDLPDAALGDHALQEATAGVIRTLAEETDGGLFALFTSHRALRLVAEILRAGGGAEVRTTGGFPDAMAADAWQDRDRATGAAVGDGRAGSAFAWPLFVHGERPRATLLADFIESGNGVLLGTASFWEGVDVPGDPLRGLVIQKLPFRVPTEPVTAARVEAIERKGGNAFYGYALPLAALRLKQGFGRLIRSRSDRGAVVLLDDRIVRRRYGPYLRGSLPDAPFVKGPWDEVSSVLRRFYRAGGVQEK